MKQIISLLMALLLISTLAACGNTVSEPTTEATQPPTSQPTQATGADLKTDDFEAAVEAEIETTLEELNTQWQALLSEVDSYESYQENADAIDAFYQQISRVSATLCIRMCEYSIDHAQALLAEGHSSEDTYDALEEIYDLIYDNAGDDIYDGIYSGILDDVYDELYSGALEDRPEDVEYSEWSDARSEEYNRWSDARSETYEYWSDFRSDVYDFWSDIRSEVWNDDPEGAAEEIEDFREDVEKMWHKLNSPSDEEPSEEASVPEKDETTEAATETEETESTAGIRPEFKEAMDSYEAYFDEYIEFMTAYNESDDPASMLAEYYGMMQQYVETMTALEEIDESKLSEEEALYYAEVMLRINQKLLEIG